MRHRRYSQFLRLRAWLAFAILVGAHAIFAEISNPSAQLADHAARAESPALPSPTIPTLQPEMQGDLFMARGSYVAAIEAYKHCSPRSAVTWNKIGIAYHHLFALEEARKNYQMALTLDPRYSAALNNLAAVYHGEHNYKRAELTYKKALKYDPDSAMAYRNLGTSYFSDGKYKQGAKAYKKALTLSPKIFDPGQNQPVEEGSSSRRERIAVSYSLAKTYAVAGENERALIYLRKALDYGFNDRRHLMEDKDFARLRSTPEFHQFIVEQHLD